MSNLNSGKWKKIALENLDLSYTQLFSFNEADKYFKKLEDEVVYFEGDLNRVKIFGKWHDIPRKQVSYGDAGLSYKFSGNTIPAQSWPHVVFELKTLVENTTGHKYNFVLLNRYKDGNDYIGEHRDDEKQIDKYTPIASLSFGAERDFIFKHCDSKKRIGDMKKIPPYKIVLKSGSLLLMNFPTNKYWYHSLPKRKSCKNVRINLTFRNMIK